MQRTGNLNQYAIVLCRTEQGTASSSSRVSSHPGQQDYMEYAGQVGVERTTRSSAWLQVTVVPSASRPHTPQEIPLYTLPIELCSAVWLLFPAVSARAYIIIWLLDAYVLPHGRTSSRYYVLPPPPPPRSAQLLVPSLLFLEV